MKVYTVKVEERPFAKAFFQVAEIISDALEHVDGDDIVSVKTSEVEQEEPKKRPVDTISEIIEMLERHHRFERANIVRSINAYYNGG